jgi:GH35 family endo-1,4-beta-xylanase
MAFRLAREADPKAKLYYNDFTSYAAAAAMIKDINDRWLAEGNKRLLIEGMGIQGHFGWWFTEADISGLEKDIKRFIDIGVDVSISELDYRIYVESGKRSTEEQYNEQALMYARLFMLFKKYSKNIERVTFWGLNDKTSLINNDYPLLFDADFNPKPAYFAVYDPEGYLAGKYDTAEQREAWIKKNSK